MENADIPPIAIIQARMTSTRLPGKVLMDICGRPALEWQISRVRKSQLVGEIIVATTSNNSDDSVVALCKQLNVKVFRGDEADVLGRFRDAANTVSAENILRLTADCPMQDPDIIDDIIRKFRSGKFDYVSNCNERTYPDGLDAEIFTRAAMEEACLNAQHPFLREHVTPYIRGSHPQYGHGAFQIGQVTFAGDFSHVRWTLDTMADLKRIRRLISILPEQYSWLEALSLATKEPDLLGLVD